MKEINEKDLEMAAGGGFGNPNKKDRSVDPEGCCAYFTPRNETTEKKCKNCSDYNHDLFNGMTTCSNKFAKI